MFCGNDPRSENSRCHPQRFLAEIGVGEFREICLLGFTEDYRHQQKADDKIASLNMIYKFFY